MKKKNTKHKNSKIVISEPVNAKCDCLDNHKVSSECEKNGTCATFNMMNVQKGFKWKEDGKILPEFQKFGEGYEALKAIFRSKKK